MEKKSEVFCWFSTRIKNFCRGLFLSLKKQVVKSTNFYEFFCLNVTLFDELLFYGNTISCNTPLDKILNVVYNVFTRRLPPKNGGGWFF